MDTPLSPDDPEYGKQLCAGGEMTVTRFFGFLRSNLRQTSRKWPPLARLALERARRAYVGPNKRQKWEFLCANCNEWHMRKEVQVDHIVECGTLRSWEDFEPFARRLFCETEGLQVLCKVCHDLKKVARKQQATEAQ